MIGRKFFLIIAVFSQYVFSADLSVCEKADIEYKKFIQDGSSRSWALLGSLSTHDDSQCVCKTSVAAYHRAWVRSHGSPGTGVLNDISPDDYQSQQRKEVQRRVDILKSCDNKVISSFIESLKTRKWGEYEDETLNLSIPELEERLND